MCRQSAGEPVELIQVCLDTTLGTYALAAAATKHKAERFLLISTDKAVRPSSVMGASKRLGGGGAGFCRG